MLLLVGGQGDPCHHAARGVRHGQARSNKVKLKQSSNISLVQDAAIHGSSLTRVEEAHDIPEKDETRFSV